MCYKFCFHSNLNPLLLRKDFWDQTVLNLFSHLQHGDNKALVTVLLSDQTPQRMSSMEPRASTQEVLPGSAVPPTPVAD